MISYSLLLLFALAVFGISSIAVKDLSFLAAKERSLDAPNPVFDLTDDVQERKDLSLISNLVDETKIHYHTDSEKQAIVDKHNEFRSQVSPTASNMKYMSWNDDLASLAGLWASVCYWGHGWPKDIRIDNFLPQGQNMWKGSKSAKPTGVNCVEAWHNNEKDFYNYSDKTCTPGEMCGHYTQVVSWKSAEIGCAYAYCDSVIDNQNNPTGETNVWIEVCNYAPGSPYPKWKPYKEGESCSDCPPGYGNCVDKLCKCNLVCSNGGTRTSSGCTCSCPNGWFGNDCSTKCINTDSRCWNAWPTRAYCTPNSETFKKCPVMCNRCTRA